MYGEQPEPEGCLALLRLLTKYGGVAMLQDYAEVQWQAASVGAQFAA